AYLAGLATGYWKDKEEIRANWQLQRSFMPSIGETKRKQKLKGWKKAVSCALFWANDEEE
ncbi:MAG: glycerol kinase, partial [Roseburia sp.]|nr:glycerol kinase [Roseburia sp.]